MDILYNMMPILENLFVLRGTSLWVITWKADRSFRHRTLGNSIKIFVTIKIRAYIRDRLCDNYWSNDSKFGQIMM